MRWRLLSSVALCAVACRSSPATQDAQAIAPVVTPTAIAALDASAPIRRASAREVVDAWNTAHVKHDAKALEALYAPTVEFYGTSLSDRECATRKKAAFDKSPDYTQSIRDVHVEASDAGVGSVVTFTKTSTVKGRSTDYPAILVVLGNVITSETDKISEANLVAQQQKSTTWCVDEIMYPPNDHVIAPYRISASEAYRRARTSAHFNELVKNANGDFLDFGQVWCPTKCVHVTSYPDSADACGYSMKLENHSELQRRINDPSGFSVMVEWVFVDAVDGTMYWQDGAKEKLPN